MIFRRGAGVLGIALGLASCSRGDEAAREASAAPPASPADPAADPTRIAANANDVPDEPGLRREPRHQLVDEALGRLAIPFQQNSGQWDRSVAFKADHFAGSLWVTTQGQLVYSLLGPELESSDSEGATPAAANPAAPATAGTPTPNALQAHEATRPRVALPSVSANNGANTAMGPAHDALPHERSMHERAPGWTLTETFVGGHSQRARGVDPSPTNVSYFIGDDESKWAPHVATFGALTLGDVWPGIEVRLVARGRNVEKFFYVRAGTDPSRIRMSVDGGAGLRITEDGALRMTTGHGDIELSPPVAFQEIDGARRMVEVRYQLNGNGYGFAVGAYDRAHELVIDPILQSTYLGGSGDEYTDLYANVAIAANGEILTVGTTAGATFPGTAGGAQAAFAGVVDVVVSRLNSTLTQLLQTTFFGGAQYDFGTGLLIASNNDVVITGTTASNNIPGRTGAARPTFAGGTYDAYVSRLGPSLTTIVRSTYLGGASDDFGVVAVALSSGEILFGGQSMSASFPGTTGGAQTTGSTNRDQVFVKLNSSLTTIVQSTFWGSGSGDEWVRDMTVASNGDVIAVGENTGGGYPGTSGGFQTASGGQFDVVLLRLNGALTAVVRASYLGGSGYEIPVKMQLASSGDLYIGGYSDSANLPGTTGGAQSASGGSNDVMVARVNPNLTQLIQSTYLGGSAQEYALSLAVLGTGEVLVGGYSAGGAFPSVAGGAQAVRRGNNEGILARLNAGLTQLLQATYLGGTGHDYVEAIALTSTDEVVAIGTTASANFPGVAGSAQTTFGGTLDLFVTRVTPDLGGCENHSQCLTSTALNVPNAAGGPIFAGLGTCNTPTEQCFACSSNANCSGATPFCNTTSGACVACISDTNCSDANPCTTDVCVSNACTVSGTLANCCSAGALCDDSNACTTDSCSASGANLVTNGVMNGGTLTTAPTSWTALASSNVGVGSAATNLGFSIPASQNVASASPSGGTFVYVSRAAATGPGVQQTLTGLVIGQRYRVTGAYQMSPGTVATRSLTTQVRAGATTYTIGRVTQ